jgi:hypothetical protein
MLPLDRDKFDLQEAFMANESKLEARLAKLSPEARSKVEEALRVSIESELSNEVGNKLKSQFSRGVFFSRSSSLDRELMDEALNLDDAKFTQFAQRMSALRKLKD